MSNNERVIIQQCARLSQQIRESKENTSVSAWRLRRMQKSLYNLTSRL